MSIRTSIALLKVSHMQESIRSRLRCFVLILTIVENPFSHRYVEAKGNKCCMAMVNRCGYSFRICIQNCTQLCFLKSEFKLKFFIHLIRVSSWVGDKLVLSQLLKGSRIHNFLLSISLFEKYLKNISQIFQLMALN